MIALEQWRAVIGCFNPRRNKTLSAKVIVLSGQPIRTGLRLLLALSLCIVLSGDVETNPGPGIEQVLTELKEFREHTDRHFEALKSDISSLRADMTALNSKVSSLTNEQSVLRQELSTLQAQVTNQEDVSDKVELMYADIDANAESITTVQDRLSAVENAVEKQEQYSRRENVLLYNIDEEDGETFWNVRAKVLDIFNGNFGATEKKLHEHDITRAHRLGKDIDTKTPSSQNKPRPIIVRFSNFMDKLSVLKTRPALREKGIGISNDLTLKQRAELQKLKDKGERGYFKNGQLVKINSDGNASRHGDRRTYLKGARQMENKK